MQVKAWPKQERIINQSPNYDKSNLSTDLLENFIEIDLQF